MEILVEKFNGLVLELLADLETVYPQLKDAIIGFKVEWELNGENKINRKYFNYFSSNILSHSHQITSKSVEIINQLDVLPGISLGFIFNEVGHNTNAEIIWKYLAALALVSTHIFQEAQKEITKAETPEDIINQMKTVGFNEEFFAEQTKAFMKILEDVQQPNTTETEQSKSSIPPQMEQVADQLFGGMIGNLAKEIAQEINPADLNIDPNNPQTILNNLLNNNSNNLMNLVQNISGKLQQKIDNGQLNQQALFNEAASIMTNMQGMPGMADMMKGGMPGGMPNIDPSMMSNLMSSLLNGAGGSKKKNNNTKNLTLLPKNHPKRRKGGN